MMRRILGGLVIAAWSTAAAAGCGSSVAQCIYFDSEQNVQFNGLCAATVCANESDSFYFIQFPNGAEVRIDFFRNEAENAGQRIGVRFAEVFEMVKWLET